MRPLVAPELDPHQREATRQTLDSAQSGLKGTSELKRQVVLIILHPRQPVLGGVRDNSLSTDAHNFLVPPQGADHSTQAAAVTLDTNLRHKKHFKDVRSAPTTHQPPHPLKQRILKGRNGFVEADAIEP